MSNAMSSIKSWYRRELGNPKDEIILSYVLAGFSLGVWMGESHPELKERLASEMPEEVVVHEEMVSDLHQEIVSHDN